MRFVLGLLSVITLAGCPHDDCGVSDGPPDLSVCAPCLDNVECGGGDQCVLLADNTYTCVGAGMSCGAVKPTCPAPSCLVSNRLITRYQDASGVCGEQIVFCPRGCVPAGAGEDGGRSDDGGSDEAHCAP